MLYHKSQSGFTLIEVIIVLAISAMLLILIFAGRQQQISQQQFSNAVQKAKAYFEETKSEVQTGVNSGGPGDGTTFAGARTGIYGYIFEFHLTGNPNVDNSFTAIPIIYDLTTNAPWSGTKGVPVTVGDHTQSCLSGIGGKTYKLAWGTFYTAGTNPHPIGRLLIRRNPATGAVESMIQRSGAVNNFPCVDTGNYTPGVGNPWEKVSGTAYNDQLHFTDAAGHAAHVSIDNTTALITVAFP